MKKFDEGACDGSGITPVQYLHRQDVEGSEQPGTVLKGRQFGVQEDAYYHLKRISHNVWSRITSIYDEPIRRKNRFKIRKHYTFRIFGLGSHL